MPKESQVRFTEFSEIFLFSVVSSRGTMNLARRFPSMANLTKTRSPAHKKNTAKNSRKSHFTIRLKRDGRNGIDEF